MGFPMGLGLQHEPILQRSPDVSSPEAQPPTYRNHACYHQVAPLSFKGSSPFQVIRGHTLALLLAVFQSVLPRAA